MKNVALLSTMLALVFVGGGLRAQQPTTPPPSAPPKDEAPRKPDPPLPSLTGKWAMALNMSMGQSTPALTLKQEGEVLTGTYAGRYGTFPIEGSIVGRAIEFSLTMTVEGEKVEMAFIGAVAPDGQSMRGNADLAQAGDGNWTATRVKN